MGDLVRTPHSEVTATLEVLDCYGVKPEHLANFRGASSYIHWMVAEALVRCDESVFADSQRSRIIDCDANPFVPDGWKVEEHRKGGQFAWDPAKLSLYLSKHQQGSKYIEGNKLRKELAGKPALNANALDYLLKHPYLIPEDWRGKSVFFWGTIYRDSDDHLFVRCLYWGGARWGWVVFCLDYGWSSGYPAVLAS